MMPAPESKSTSISDLAPELLDKIIHYVVQRAPPGGFAIFLEAAYNAHIGHYRTTWRSSVYRSASRGTPASITTLNASLVNKAFRDIVQNQLFRSATLPQTDGSCRLSAQMLLARSLMERPDLANKVRRLLIEIGCNSYDRSPIADFFLDVTSLFDTLGLSEARSEDWEQQIRIGNHDTFAGVVLALVPNLTSLHIKTDCWPKMEVFKPLFGSYLWEEKSNPEGLEGLDTIPGLANLRELRLSATAPVRVEGLGFLTNIKHLDLTLRTYYTARGLLSAEMQMGYEQHDLDQFQHIERLSLDCCILRIGSKLKDFLMHLTNLAPAFKNVRNLKLYDELQVDFLNVDEIMPHNQYNDWTDTHDNNAAWYYATCDDLIESLQPLHDSVESLELQNGFWTVPRYVDTHPVKCLYLFRKLKLLITNKAALLGTRAETESVLDGMESDNSEQDEDQDQDPDNTAGNEGFNQDGIAYDDDNRDDIEHPDLPLAEDIVDGLEGLTLEQDESQGLANDDEDSRIVGTYQYTSQLAPSCMLPRMLESLKITDADESCCNWVTGIFREHYYFRNLAKVELELVEQCEADRERLTDMLIGAAMDTTIWIEVK